MPLAIVSPTELAAFARQLEKISESIVSRKSKAARFVADSRTVWKDEKYKQFHRTFEETVKELDRFARMAKDYSSFLEKKAGLARKYLDRR